MRCQSPSCPSARSPDSAGAQSQLTEGRDRIFSKFFSADQNPWPAELVFVSAGATIIVSQKIVGTAFLG